MAERCMISLAPILLVVLLLLCGAATDQEKRNNKFAWGLQYCEDDDMYGIYGHCRDSILHEGPWVSPSPLCCSFIADVDKMRCVCRYLITGEVEKVISIPRLVCAANLCGAPLDYGTQCGSYTVPQRGMQCGKMVCDEGFATAPN